MVFSIKDKEKVWKKRIKYEANWKGFRIWECILFLATPVIQLFICVAFWGEWFYNGTVRVEYQDIAMLYACIISFVPFLALVIVLGIHIGMAARINMELLKEQVWVDEKKGILYQSWRPNCGGGLLAGTPGNREILLAIDINSICNLRYESKSKRLEFISTGMLYVFDNYHIRVPSIEKRLINQKNVFYDYYEPGLLDYFLKKGYPAEETAIKFKKMEKKVSIDWELEYNAKK